MNLLLSRGWNPAAKDCDGQHSKVILILYQTLVANHCVQPRTVISRAAHCYYMQCQEPQVMLFIS